MQRPAESVVPFELAREIATREGAKAVLDGEIVRLGQSYVVSARLVSAMDGQELATFRETAANEDELIGALGDLCRSVRLAELGAAIADPELSRRALAGSERDQAPTARDPIGRRAYYSAHVALAERRWDAAVGLLREAHTRTSMDQRHAMAQVGRAYDLAGSPDSAMVYYEKFSAPGMGSPTRIRAGSPGPIAGSASSMRPRGKTRQEIERYARFVELWADADPELQSQVSEVRSRLELRAQVG
jgi:hypothetical protein